MVGLEILKQVESQLLGMEEDCMVMAYLTQYLRGVANTDTGTAHKAEVASTNVNRLLHSAYRNFGSLDNNQLVQLRQRVRLRVVQHLQDTVSRSAVRSAGEESLLEREQLKELHRAFHDGCMKVGGGAGEKKARGLQ